MNRLIAACVVLILATAAFGQKSELDPQVCWKARDLGHGYSLRNEQVECRGCVEAIGSITAIYFENTRLGRTLVCSVSPSGRYAAWYGTDSGTEVFLFDRETKHVQPVVLRSDGNIKKFRWDEPSGLLTVDYHGDPHVLAPTLIPLTNVGQPKASD